MLQRTELCHKDLLPLSSPGEMGVFPPQEKRSVPMLNSMVDCRYLQSWLTVAMKCRVMYSYSRQPSLPAEQHRTIRMRS